MRDWFNKRVSLLESHSLAVPLILSVVTFLTYGLFFLRLGFYWDDQPISWIRYELGPEATTRYFSDLRPVWALLYQVTGYIIPQNPIYWQLFAMFWRWAGVVAFWKVLTKLFPDRQNIAFLFSLLFLTYTGFNQQWVSYVYSHFFIVLFFFLFSLYLMLQNKTLLSIVFSALNLLMLEYFFLLEFVRPIIIFMCLREESFTNRERFTKTFKTWLPYLSAFIPAVLYRTFVHTHPGFGYSLKDELIKAPVKTLLHLISQMSSDLWTSTLGAWIQAFQLPDSSMNGLRTYVLYILVILIVGAIIFFWNKNQVSKSEQPYLDAEWLLGLGGVLFLLGGIPYWLTNIPITLAFPANRALLSFMLGASFLLLGIIELLPHRIKYIVAIIYISFSAGRQFSWSADYMRTWETQKNMFWQMAWRVPGLKENTVVLMNEELEFNAHNSLSGHLNWIYSPENSKNPFNYVLLYPTNRTGLSLTPNSPVEFDYLAGKFNGNTSQAVVFYYAPPKCLRLLDPEIDSINRLIPDETMLRDAALLSSTAPILNEQVSQMPDIYQPEPTHGWCYYFQKADLARQLGDWSEVTHLGDTAFALDDYPNDPVERFVFIEGYAHNGDWQKAVEYSIDSYKVSKNYIGPLLCTLWNRIERETESSQEKEIALIEVQNNFECVD